MWDGQNVHMFDYMGQTQPFVSVVHGQNCVHNKANCHDGKKMRVTDFKALKRMCEIETQLAELYIQLALMD